MAKFSIDNVSDDQIVQHCIDGWLVPVAKQMLVDNTDIKTVVVAFGSYYNDEAEDGVHDAFLPLSGDFETWEKCFDHNCNSFASKDDEYRKVYYGGLNDAAKKVFGEEKYYMASPYLDNDERFIAAFSSYCEHTTQDLDQFEAYTPMLIVSRNDDGSFRVRDLRNAMDLLS